MAIIINKPIILTESQTKKFQSVYVCRIGESLLAKVTFNVYADDESFVREEVLQYTGADFDVFWTNFNSGKFLYEELVKNDEDEIEVPDDIEDEFINIAVEEEVDPEPEQV